MSPRLAVISLMAAGLAVVLVFTLTPWNFIPTQVTENVTVIAVTDHGCVGESQYGISVVVPECSAQVWGLRVGGRSDSPSDSTGRVQIQRQYGSPSGVS